MALSVLPVDNIDRHVFCFQLALREVMPGPVGHEFFAWLMDAAETFFYENGSCHFGLIKITNLN